MSGIGAEEEWGQGNGERTQTTVGRWWGRSQRGSAGSDSDGEDSDWGCGPGPSECRRDIGKQGIGSGNGPDDGTSGMPDGSGGEWKEGEPVRGLQSTRIQRVEGHVLRQTVGGRMRPRRWRMMWCG